MHRGAPASHSPRHRPEQVPADVPLGVCTSCYPAAAKAAGLMTKFYGASREPAASSCSPSLAGWDPSSPWVGGGSLASFPAATPVTAPSPSQSEAWEPAGAHVRRLWHEHHANRNCGVTPTKPCARFRLGPGEPAAHSLSCSLVLSLWCLPWCPRQQGPTCLPVTKVEPPQPPSPRHAQERAHLDPLSEGAQDLIGVPSNPGWLCPSHTTVRLPSRTLRPSPPTWTPGFSLLAMPRPLPVLPQESPVAQRGRRDPRGTADATSAH